MVWKLVLAFNRFRNITALRYKVQHLSTSATHESTIWRETTVRLLELLKLLELSTSNLMGTSHGVAVYQDAVSQVKLRIHI